MRLSNEKTCTATSTHPGIPCHNQIDVPPRYFHPHAFGTCALCPRQTVRRDALNHTAPCTHIAVRYDCTRHEFAPQLQRVRSAPESTSPSPLPQISRLSRRRSTKTNGPFRIHVPRGKDTCIRKKSNWSSDYRSYAHCSPNALVILIHMLSAARLVVPPPDPHSFTKHTTRPSSQDKRVPAHANQCDLVDRCQNGAQRILRMQHALQKRGFLLTSKIPNSRTYLKTLAASPITTIAHTADAAHDTYTQHVADGRVRVLPWPMRRRIHDKDAVIVRSAVLAATDCVCASRATRICANSRRWYTHTHGRLTEGLYAVIPCLVSSSPDTLR